jgi:SAM-dependent methyltransferase
MSHGVAMRRDWDERARKDAFYYIASWRRSWDPEQFFQSGEADYQSLVAPVFAILRFEPQDKAMLEIGCGLGRMTRSFAQRFARAYALDVSAEMVRQGRALHQEKTNVLWLSGNGSDLAFLKSGSLDFVFSYLVLQHVPTKALALDYIREMLRVLKAGGVFHFQFNSRCAPTMNWKGRVVWGVLDRLREPVFGISPEKTGRLLAFLLGLDPLAAGKTWRGAVLDVQEVKETVSACGGDVSGVTDSGTQVTWCYGRRR